MAMRVAHRAGAGPSLPQAEGSPCSQEWPRLAAAPRRGVVAGDREALGPVKEAPYSEQCDFRQERVASIEEIINPRAAERDGTRRIDLSDTEIRDQQEKLFSRQGFTPYLVSFVAQALSAMGDHSGAVRMLMGWQRDLNELVGHAGARANVPDVGEVTTAALHRRPSTPRRDEARRLLLAAPWYRLATFVDTLVLQELSENTDFAVTPTEAGLRHVVMQLFPEVLSQVSQGTLVQEWRVGRTQACKEATHSWMQPLVLAYATWIKGYLDKRNKNLVQPEDVTEQDLAFADLLAQLDLECFPTSLRGEEAAAEQRLQFAVTATAIKLNRVVDGRFDAQRREDLRVELQALIRGAIHGFESARGYRAESAGDPELDRLKRLVFAKDDLVLRAARTIKKRLDNLAGH
jgi:hypothetical protein